jgi:heterodisulfide reductase subunit C
MTVAQLPPKIYPDSEFRKEVEKRSGAIISACYQCEKCTNGCPVTFAMDIPPHKVIRSVHLGLKNEVLDSDTIWVCASCETCTTRCPNGIDIAHIMDTLRQLSLSNRNKVSQPQIPVFHDAFLSSIRRHGRVNEMEMALMYYLKAEGLKGLLKQAGMGIGMFFKGKIKLVPARIHAVKQVRALFNNALKKGER